MTCSVKARVIQTVEVFQAKRIQRLPDHFPPALATLSIIDLLQLADNALNNLAAQTPHLADLNLKGCDIPRLPQQLPKTLTHVIFSQHVPMSPESLNNLKEHRPTLTSLALTRDGFTQWPQGLPLSLHTLPVSAKLIQHASKDDFARPPDLSLLIITPDPSHPLPAWLKQHSPDITLMT